MKKFLKNFLVLVLGYTIGEFVTTWRYSSEPLPFKKYMKSYFKAQKVLLKEANSAVDLLLDGKTEEGTKEFKKLFNPHLSQ